MFLSCDWLVLCSFVFMCCVDLIFVPSFGRKSIFLFRLLFLFLHSMGIHGNCRWPIRQVSEYILFLFKTLSSLSDEVR